MANLTFLEAIALGMREEMERDPHVFLMGEDIGAFGGAFKVTQGFLDRFGAERVIDTPICEEAIVGAAIGAGYVGMRPVVEFQFIDFIACAFDMIVNFAATSRYRWGRGVPITMRGPWGGGVRGGPFHSRNPEMWFVHSPGLKVVAPATPYDAKGLIKACIRDNDPCIFLEHKYLYRRIREEVPEEDYVVPIGEAKVVRPGEEMTLVTYGMMLHRSLEAVQELGRSIEVIDLRSLYPLDRRTVIESVRNTNRLLLVHEDTRTGGIAAEIAASVCEEAFDDLDAPIARVTAPDTPVPYSPPLEDFFLPNKDAIAQAAEKLLRY